VVGKGLAEGRPIGRTAGALRVLALWLGATWAGGFATYGGIVLPLLHRDLGVADSAWITRDVTRGLNGLGSATLLAWFIALCAGFARGAKPTRLTLGLLMLAAGTLITQYTLHPILASRMDHEAVHSSGFYPVHRAYLILSTVQWVANLGLVAFGRFRRIDLAPAASLSET